MTERADTSIRSGQAQDLIDSIQRVSIFAAGRPGVAELENRLRDRLLAHGCTVDRENPQLIFALGGDGTVLRAAKVAHAYDVPLLGVNLGKLGFLAEADPIDLEPLLDGMLEGLFEIQPRAMLNCRATDSAGSTEHQSLNEALVGSRLPHRLVRLESSVSNVPLRRFVGDALLVSTPTGSTAYALSAGGPVVFPAVQCLILVGLNPHGQAFPPLVIGAGDKVEIFVDPGDKALLVVDGRDDRPLNGPATVQLSTDVRPLKLVRMSGTGFVERLKAKLPLLF